MSKKLLSIIAGVSGTVAIIGTLVWGYFAQDKNGIIHLEGNENYSYILFAFALVALITGSIALRATNEKGEQINKKAIYSGLAVAVIIFIWRLSVTL